MKNHKILGAMAFWDRHQWLSEFVSIEMNIRQLTNIRQVGQESMAGQEAPEPPSPGFGVRGSARASSGF